jgi:hypothetical protein
MNPSEAHERPLGVFLYNHLRNWPKLVSELSGAIWRHSMSKATEKELSALHGELAKFLKYKLQAGEVTAADLGQIRQFLKDNRIEASIDQNPDMGSIVQALPSFETSEDEYDDSEGSYH